jgi:glucose-1-phosphate thymidylyltransferase
LLEAAQFIETLERRQGPKIAWQAGWISDEDLETLAEPLSKNGYGQYLLGLLEYV